MQFRLSGSLRSILCITAFESLHAALRIDELLLAGKERVTLAADSELNLFSGRPGYKTIAAAASYVAFFVLWVRLFFHDGISFWPDSRA